MVTRWWHKWTAAGSHWSNSSQASASSRRAMVWSQWQAPDSRHDNFRQKSVFTPNNIYSYALPASQDTRNSDHSCSVSMHLKRAVRTP